MKSFPKHLDINNKTPEEITTFLTEPMKNLIEYK